MDIRNQYATCESCGHRARLTPSELKDKIIEIDGIKLYAVYTECPLCGEKSLKQIDNRKTYDLKNIIVKLRLRQHRGKKLSAKQKKKLLKLDHELNTERRNLNSLYYNQVYQSLNES